MDRDDADRRERERKVVLHRGLVGGEELLREPRLESVRAEGAEDDAERARSGAECDEELRSVGHEADSSLRGKIARHGEDEDPARRARADRLELDRRARRRAETRLRRRVARAPLPLTVL